MTIRLEASDPAFLWLGEWGFKLHHEISDNEETVRRLSPLVAGQNELWHLNEERLQIPAGVTPLLVRIYANGGHAVFRLAIHDGTGALPKGMRFQ